MRHACTACCGHVAAGKTCYKCGLHGPPKAPQTHHEDCYHEHHACAVARLDRLREAMEGLPPGPWTHRRVGPWVSVYDANNELISQVSGADTETVLVAVRDITEGR